MKRIGIVCKKAPAATALKAAVLALDPAAEVRIAHLEFPQDTEASGFLESDKRILMYNAIEGLAAQGVTVVGFGCQCAHKIVGELAPEVAPRLVDPVDAEGNALSVEDYARAILAADPALPAKPFKIGVIGGLGPAASVDLYDKITRFTPAATDQEHLKVAVEQNPQTPDRTVALLEGGANPTLAMYKAARHLEAVGCDVITIGCNTAYAFVPGIERHLKTPFLNMQQVTIDEIKAKLGAEARIGLLATTGTVRTRIYAGKAEAAGLPMFVPDAERQERVMRAIYGPLGVKAGYTEGQCHDDIMAGAEYLVREHGCNVLVLGCTELPLILDEGDMEVAGKTAWVIDPTSALARAAVKMAVAANKERAGE